MMLGARSCIESCSLRFKLSASDHLGGSRAETCSTHFKPYPGSSQTWVQVRTPSLSDFRKTVRGLAPAAKAVAWSFCWYSCYTPKSDVPRSDVDSRYCHPIICWYTCHTPRSDFSSSCSRPHRLHPSQDATSWELRRPGLEKRVKLTWLRVPPIPISDPKP